MKKMEIKEALTVEKVDQSIIKKFFDKRSKQ